MNRVEQAYIDYVRINLLPVFKKYISDEVNPETIKLMNNEIAEILKSHMIKHDWEVVPDSLSKNYCRDIAIKSVLKYKTENPESFKSIMSYLSPPDAFLNTVGCLPIAGASHSEFQSILDEVNNMTQNNSSDFRYYTCPNCQSTDFFITEYTILNNWTGKLGICNNASKLKPQPDLRGYNSVIAVCNRCSHQVSQFNTDLHGLIDYLDKSSVNK